MSSKVRFALEQYGYKEEELSRYLSGEEEKGKHISELCSITDFMLIAYGIGERSYGPNNVEGF